MTLHNRRVLVTGANGFIGTHLCKALCSLGAEVIGFVKNPRGAISKFGEERVIDILDRNEVQRVVHEIQPNFVVHLAASKNRSLEITEYRIGYETNLFGSLNLIEACEKLSCLSQFVFLGSCDEYGQIATPFHESSRANPASAYGASKLAVTQLLQTLALAKDFPSVVLRPTVVYGPGQGQDMFLPALIKSLLIGMKFDMSLGEQTRDFLYIDDLVNAVLMVLEASNVKGQVINVSSASRIHIHQLAKMVACLIAPENEKLIEFGAINYRVGEAMDYCASNARANELLRWMPHVSLEEGLRKTIEHFRASAMTN